jgi:hypothetical protein
MELDRVKLVATPDTERAIQLGETPSWLLLRVNGDGTTDYYINGETGRPMTFSLPDGTADKITRWLHTLPAPWTHWPMTALEHFSTWARS